MITKDKINIITGVNMLDNIEFSTWCQNYYVPERTLIQAEGASEAAALIETIMKHCKVPPENLGPEVLFAYPENFLHPTNQIEVVKAIIEFAKHYGKTVIVFSQSPYIFEAFEVYTADHEQPVMWLVESDKITNVSYIGDKIYKTFFYPYEEMEKHRYDE